MSELIISVSGLRGIVGETLTAEVAKRFVNAFLEKGLAGGPVVVARDGRASGAMLAEAVADAVQAAGRQCLYADVAATPTVGRLVKEHRAAAGVQVSASHNPVEWNGLKLFGSDGRVIPAAVGQSVIDRFQNPPRGFVEAMPAGSRKSIADTTSDHLAAVLATVDVDAIRQRRFKAVLDANHGSGTVLGRKLLETLGCQVTIHGEEPTGEFIHRPEPTAENLREVARQSVEAGADVVFCQDPDADRLAIIDAGGRYIGEEYTLALVLDHVLPQLRGHVVTNCSTSRMAADLAAKHGCTFSLAAVGEANVTDEMIRRNAVYGGEGNGGPIDPRVGYVRDSFVGMAQVLDAMAASGRSIAQMVACLPRYEICKTTIPIARNLVPALLDCLEKTFPEATVSRLDGLRLDWPDGKWLLIRPSNTEPIVRAVAEAKSLAAAQHLCDKSANLSGQL